MAPRDTAVLATEDGTVVSFIKARAAERCFIKRTHRACLFITTVIYQARHGIAEGKQEKRGEVIAYVGDTGNAGPGNYHLHFGISRVTLPGKWSGGEPIAVPVADANKVRRR